MKFEDDRDERREPVNWCKWLCVAMVIFMIATPVYALITVVFPTDAKWNRQFGSHEIMAKDQATFEGMEDQVKVLWSEMNKTFAPAKQNDTFSTWWYPDQTYDNSLGAQRDYFNQLLKSIQRYKATYTKMLENGSSPIMLEDWYYKSITNLRNEMNREGGLCWALHDAWYYNLHPTCYWLHCYFIVFFIITIPITLVLAGKALSF